MYLSSIFNFNTLKEPTNILKRTLLSVLVVLFFLVAIDFAARYFKPIDLYGGWEHQQAYTKLYNYIKYSEKEDIDVLLFGNSCNHEPEPR